jgi:hypothetical protein
MLLMTAFLAADCSYLYYMMSQYVGKMSSMADFTAFIFKLTMMTMPTLVPFFIGQTACRLGGHACRAVLRIPDGFLPVPYPTSIASETGSGY